MRAKRTEELETAKKRILDEERIQKSAELKEKNKSKIADQKKKN